MLHLRCLKSRKSNFIIYTKLKGVVCLIQIGKPSIRALLVHTDSARTIMRMPLSPILVYIV